MNIARNHLGGCMFLGRHLSDSGAGDSHSELCILVSPWKTLPLMSEPYYFQTGFQVSLGMNRDWFQDSLRY